ncbi:MAG: phosphate ABC transporter substrate-binding protein PstS [Pyrinomonadaceae bacterium]
MPSLRQTARAALAAALASLVTIASACSPGPAGGGAGPNAPAGGAVRLQGAGATFPNPLYQKWLSEYGKLNAGARIDYQSVGSGAGIKQITEQTIDFGGTDKPMSDDEMKNAPGEILHIPTVLGAVVVTYNLAGVSETLGFSPDVLADIFLGKITKWNDPRIKADNPNVNLPDAPIAVVHRSDGSGTTAVFTDYLSKVSPEWKEKVGTGTAVSWPLGQGGKGNEGVTAQVKSQPNTIGYVELAYAQQNKLPVARLKNKSGNFVEPTLDAVTAAAAESVAATPEDLRVSVTDAAGAGAYPVASYTYVLVYKDQKDAAKGKALVDFLWWAIHDGERFAKDLQYAPLPPEVVKRAEAKLNSVTSGGKPLRQ